MGTDEGQGWWVGVGICLDSLVKVRGGTVIGYLVPKSLLLHTRQGMEGLFLERP